MWDSHLKLRGCDTCWFSKGPQTNDDFLSNIEGGCYLPIFPMPCSTWPWLTGPQMPSWKVKVTVCITASLALLCVKLLKYNKKATQTHVYTQTQTYTETVYKYALYNEHGKSDSYFVRVDRFHTDMMVPLPSACLYSGYMSSLISIRFALS